jgi:hypothetical protein
MLKQIELRQKAAQNGHKRFWTGVPCKHGHLAERFTSNGGCVKCVNTISGSPGSGMVWLDLGRYPWPEGVALPPERAVELESLIRGWTEYKLREWGMLEQPTPRWDQKPGHCVQREDGTWTVINEDGVAVPTTQETAKADIERIKSVVAERAAAG